MHKYFPAVSWAVAAITILLFSIINHAYGYPYMFLAFGTISCCTFILNLLILKDSRKKGE